ncbi:hypothetical protein Tco_0087315 [Tanacetum coccineum]
MNREVARFNSLVDETKVMNRERDDDWMTRIEILYKSVTGMKFKHKSAWLFLKDKHNWKNPNSTNARRNRGRVNDEEPELFGDDELPRPPCKQRVAKKKTIFKLDRLFRFKSDNVSRNDSTTIRIRPYSPLRKSESSVKEIYYVQLGIVNQAELNLQPRAFFSFCTAAYTEVKILKVLNELNGSLQPIKDDSQDV